MATTPISNAPRETPELGLSTNDPVSPTSTRFENGKLLFGGFEVTGVDINKLERGKLSVSMPLNPGDYELPGEYDITRVEVPKNCVLQVDLLIEKNESGQPSIKIGEAVFSEPFVIKNPTGALSPTATKYPWLNWILDILKDFLANFHIERIGLDDDDFLRVHGHAKVAGVANLDQKEAIKKLNRTLSLPMDPANPPPPVESTTTSHAELARLEAEPSSPPDTSSQNPPPRKSALKPKLPPPTLDDVPALLKEIGAMTGRAKISLEGTTSPMQLGIKGHGLEVQGGEGEIRVSLTGEAELSSEGKINLKILHSPEPLIATAFAAADGVGYMDLEFDKDSGLEGDGEVAFKTRLENMRGRFHPHNALEIPMDLSGPDVLRGEGRTGVSLRDGGVKLSDGNFNVALDNKVAEASNIRAGETHLDIDDGRIIVSADGSFEASETGASIWDTTFDLRIEGEDGIVNYEDYRARIDGILKTQLLAHGIKADTRSGESSLGGGDFNYLIDPRREDLRDEIPFPTFNGELKFKILPDGKLTIIPGKNPVADLLVPFVHINGRKENIVDPKAPAVGAVGSAEMMSHIEKMTGAKVRSNNRTELLADGVESFPKRLALLAKAKESICLQTFIFKDDETGSQIVQHLIDAADRGVDVRVLVDTLGNVQGINDIFDEKPLYRRLRENGVKVALYNDPRKTGLSGIIDAMKEIPALRKIDGPQTLKDPKIALQIFDEILKVSSGIEDVPEHVRDKVRAAIAEFGKSSKILSLQELKEISTGTLTNKTHKLILIKLVAELNHRWHEKSMIVDGNEAIVGGLNICDEYMLGGTGRTIGTMGAEREAWRDTDMYLAGPAVRDTHSYFAENWKHLTGEDIPKPSGEPLEITENASKVQIISHHPRIEGDHHITNVMIENLKALGPGEIAYVENSYFLPTGALTAYKEAMIDAAERGVDVRVLTNSATTTDLSEINYAAVFPYRELLRAGVRIFERSGERTLHSKMCVFGDNTSVIGSWNADNRSASLNSEIVAVTYDENLAKKLRSTIENDMAEDVAVEIKLEDLESLPWETEIRNSAVSVLSSFM